MVDANAKNSQFDLYPEFLFCFTPCRLGNSLAWLHSAARYNPVASAIPLALDEGKATSTNYQYSSALNLHISIMGSLRFALCD